MKAFTALLGALIVCAMSLVIAPAPARGSGGGGAAGVDRIKVTKCEYADTGSYVELLLHASSSDTTTHLYAYLPTGAYLGEVQNGSAGRYGGTVFLTFGVPQTITIISSKGGSVTAPCTPYQP